MTILIIPEDLTVINSLAGIWGKTYSRLINLFQQINLKLLKIIIPNSTIISWDKTLSENKLDKERPLAWQIVNQDLSRYFSNLSCLNIGLIEVWQTYLAIHISHKILSYHQAIKRELKKKPTLLITFGVSHQEVIARFIAKKENIKQIRLPLLTFSTFNKALLNWLYSRQLKTKAQTFIQVTQKKNNQRVNGSILVASFFRHLKTLVPLHSKLTNSCIVYDDSKTQEKIINQSNSFNLASQLTVKQKYASYHASLKQGKKEYQLVKKSIPTNPQTINQLTISLVHGYLKTMFLHAFPLVNLYLHSTDSFLKSSKPKSIVLVSDVRPLEVSFGLLAQKYKISSLLISPNAILSLDAINQYNLTNKVAVIGPHLRGELQKLNLASNKIHLTGDLRFDWINQKQLSKIREKTLKDLKLKPNLNLFLLVSFRENPQIPLKEKKAFFQIASKAVSQVPNSKLIIKPHPTESRGILANQVKAWKIKNFLITNNQRLELIDILSVSQATLLTWSMTGFESLITKTPVIVINPTNKNYDKIIPYIKGGGAQLATNSDQLTTILNKFLTNKNNYQTWVNNGLKFVNKFIKQPDGQTANRVIKLLNS